MDVDQPTISDAELDVLKVLWQHGPSTVRDVNERLETQNRSWAYNTVLTLLSRLRDKGYVRSEKQGMAHVFEPIVSREKLLQQRLADLTDRVCDGTASPLLHALVEGHRFSPDEIKHFRQLLDELSDQ